MGNETVATVKSGLLDAKELGMTSVIGRAVGIDPESGFIVYSQVSYICGEDKVLCDGLKC